MTKNMTVNPLWKRRGNFMQSFCIGPEKKIHCSGGYFRMLSIMDRIKKIILIISAWMKFIKISVQIRQDFRRKGSIPGFVPFPMKSDLYTWSIADDIIQLHIDRFFNPASGFRYSSFGSIFPLKRWIDFTFKYNPDNVASSSLQ